MKKLVWTVPPVPTGQYRSFYKRGWPWAEYNGQMIISLACADDYRHQSIKTGNHTEISIRIADWSGGSPAKGAFVWRRLKQRAKTLAEAKNIAQKFFDEHPEVFIPKQKESI